MVRRFFGKLAFFTLQDDTSTVQLQFDKKTLSQESFEQLKSWTDSGDIIGVHGTMRRTDKVSERSERALRKTSILAMKCAKWPQT